MYIKKKWIPTIAFVSLALILAFLSLFQPWWTVGTAPEAEIIVDGGVRTEYRIVKTVLLYKRTGDQVFSLYVYLNTVNVTSNPEVVNEIYSVYDMTLLLEVSGIVLAAIVLVMAVLIDKRILRIVWVIGMLAAAVLVLVAPLYFMNNFVPKISKLDQFTPVTLSKEYIPIKPSNVTTFFGNMTVPETGSFPSWALGRKFWMWGASNGFFLALAASIMLFTGAVLVNSASTRRK
jgi:hypothetical protein